MLWALLSKNSLAVMALCALVGWAHFGIKKHDQKVARAAVAEVEKVTEHAATIGKRAATRSVSPSVRGIRDPTTRND